MQIEQAGYAAGFIEQATETETPLPEIFALTREFLGTICAIVRPQPHDIFALELKLLRELGPGAGLAETRLTPGAKKIVRRCCGWRLAGLFPAEADQCANRRIAAISAGIFCMFHLGRLPRGRAAGRQRPHVEIIFPPGKLRLY